MGAVSDTPAGEKVPQIDRCVCVCVCVPPWTKGFSTTFVPQAGEWSRPAELHLTKLSAVS